MGLTVIAVIGAFAIFVVGAIFAPWIGYLGYSFFCILVPQWNWRFELPFLDLQKYVVGATFVGFLMTKRGSIKVPRRVRLPLLCLGFYLLSVALSLWGSIAPIKSSLYFDITWKLCLMVVMGVILLDKAGYIAIVSVSMIVAMGWNAYQVNKLYFEAGYINIFFWKFSELDNNTFSIFCLPVSAIAASLMFQSEKILPRMLAFCVFILQLHQLMILESRGTMLGTVVMLGLLVLFMRKTKFSMFLLVVSALIASVLAGPSVIEEFMSSFEAAENLDASADSRFRLWRAGAKIMGDYPLFGVGAWAAENIVPDYYDYGPGGTRGPVKALHNLFFEVGTGIGIPGLIAYLIFFGNIWFQHFLEWKNHRVDFPEWFRIVNTAVLCGLPGFWVASMFSSGALIETPYLLCTLGLASLVVIEVETEENCENPEFPSRVIENATADALV
jgi:O-antigen ligase